MHPPLTVALAANVTVLPCPPLMEQDKPFAVLLDPPLTEQYMPLTVLLCPPLTEQYGVGARIGRSERPTGGC